MNKSVDIHIITCSGTSARLENLLIKLQPLSNLRIIDNIKLIARHDIGYICGNFVEALWSTHIQDIYPILAKNASDSFLATNANEHSQESLCYLLGEDPDKLFPARKLRTSEKSLLCKHYESLRLANKTVLTLEDDAELISDTIEYLEELLRAADKLCYIDLGYYPGLTKRGRYVKINDCHAVYSTNVALTRTTLATIMSLETAKLLRNSYWPCSLPADLHMQRLLYSAGIEGSWSEIKVFRSLSTEGAVKSSIQ
jgi:hypothetical protein